MKPSRVFQIYIRTTPEALWQAITDGALTQQYYFGTRVESSWQAGDDYRYRYPNGAPMIEGQVLESDPPYRLRTTFHPVWEEALAVLPPSVVTYEIEPTGNTCKLTVTHEEMVYESAVADSLAGGWTQILSSLKSLLETGHPLVFEGEEEGGGR